MTTTLFLLCLKIFFCRILDVSLMTLRTILTVKGKKLMAALAGFFEVMIWFLVVRNALSSNESGIALAIAYAAGFATGTYIGGLIAKRVIKGTVDVHIVTSNSELFSEIRSKGYAVTTVNVNSSEFGGEKYMGFAEVKTSNLEDFKKIVYQYDPGAFISVQETTYVHNGFIK